MGIKIQVESHFAWLISQFFLLVLSDKSTKTWQSLLCKQTSIFSHSFKDFSFSLLYYNMVKWGLKKIILYLINFLNVRASIKFWENFSFFFHYLFSISSYSLLCTLISSLSLYFSFTYSRSVALCAVVWDIFFLSLY